MTTTVTGVAAPTLDARLVPRIGLRRRRAAGADVRARLRGRRGRGRPAARPGGRRSRRGRRAAVGRAVLADRPAGRRQHGQPGRQRALRRRCCGGRAGRRPAGRRCSAWTARRSSRPAAGSTRTPSGSWAGTSAAAASASCWPRASPTSSRSTSGHDVIAVPRRPRPQGLRRRLLGGASRWPQGAARHDAHPRAAPRAHWTAPGGRWSRWATCRRPRCCTCSRTSAGRASCTGCRTYDVMLAMGPGFCSELVLLRW